MSKKLTTLTIAAMLLTLSWGQALAVEFETENFTTNPGWTLGGGSGGWYNSTARAGDGKEGSLTGPDGAPREYYADTDLGGTLTESDNIYASGNGYATSDEMHFGHFNTGDLSSGYPTLGLEIHGGPSAWAIIDGILSPSGVSAPWLLNKKFWWKYTYDGSTKTITVDVADNAAYTGNAVQIVYTNAAADFDINSFGLVVATTNGPRNGNMDNVEYTIVPEPATVAILGLGSLVLLRRRR